MLSVRGSILGTVLIAGTVVAPAASGTTGASGIDWQPCPDAPSVECATLQVPLDWANPAGPTTRIGLAMRPAKDPARRLGSIVMDPGGPGGSGVEIVKEGYPFTEPVNERFDSVGIDPRGVGTSEQVLCDQTLRQEAIDAWNPTSQAEFDHLVDVNRRLAADCRARTGPLADHMDSLQSAYDLDAVRAALGEKKLNYIGYSYGTLMGQQYAELFPHRIRTLINDGNMDHSIRTPWEWSRKHTAVLEDNFLAFADWCDTTSTCPLYGQDTKKVYADLKKRSQAGTLVDPSTGQPLDFYNLTLVTFQTYLPQQWPQVATRLRALHDGTPTVATREAEVVNEVYWNVMCADLGIELHSLAEYNTQRARLAKLFPNVEWTPYVGNTSQCVGDPIELTNPPHKLRVEGAPPLVMIGNTHDPATPLAFSRTAARQSGSHLITYEGWGHTAYYPGEQVSPCVNAAVEAYLIHLTVPGRLTCPSPADTP
jgi:pimeloyl-ACP methyl ester carboxylesterase